MKIDIDCYNAAKAPSHINLSITIGKNNNLYIDFSIEFNGTLKVK